MLKIWFAVSKIILLEIIKICKKKQKEVYRADFTTRFKKLFLLQYKMIIEIVLKSLYLFLPAYFANMAPVLLRWIPFLGKPIHSRLFGEHKTWRGLIVAPLAAVLIFSLQKIAYRQDFTSLALIDYDDFSLLYGFLLGLGAILGDLVKSYFKRRAKIKPGERWLFWDQLDFVFGALILSGFVYVPAAEVALIIVVFTPFLHIATNHLGFWLKIRKEKW